MEDNACWTGARSDDNKTRIMSKDDYAENDNDADERIVGFNSNNSTVSDLD